MFYTLFNSINRTFNKYYIQRYTSKILLTNSLFLKCGSCDHEYKCISTTYCDCAKHRCEKTYDETFECVKCGKRITNEYKKR